MITMVLTVGNSCTNRQTLLSMHNRTFVIIDHPVTENGTIDKICYWCNYLSSVGLKIRFKIFRFNGLYYDIIHTDIIDRIHGATGAETFDIPDWNVKAGDFVGGWIYKCINTAVLKATTTPGYSLYWHYGNVTSNTLVSSWYNYGSRNAAVYGWCETPLPSGAIILSKQNTPGLSILGGTSAGKQHSSGISIPTGISLGAK